MRTILIMTVALLAGASAAAAQDSYGTFDSGSAPAIILPEQLTSPITGDFTPRDDAGQTADDTAQGGSGGEWQAPPYAVEGEETLDPDSN